jgi:hypothetical protein
MSVQVPVSGLYISAVLRDSAGSFALPVPPVTRTLPSGRSVVFGCLRLKCISIPFTQVGVPAPMSIRSTVLLAAG